MAGWNGAGAFARLYSWVTDDSNGIDITASRMDADTNLITGNGFNNCLTRDGQGSATANLPMNTFRHTGVGNAAARTDYPATGQIQDGVLDFAITSYTLTGGVDIYTGTLAPAITAYVDGADYRIRIGTANTATNPTLNLNGIGAHVIYDPKGASLIPGQLPVGFEGIFRYQSSGTKFVVINLYTVGPVLLASGSPANALSFAITGAISTAYNSYKLRIWNYNIIAGNPGPALTVSINNGSSYLGSGYGSRGIAVDVGGVLAVSAGNALLYYNADNPTTQCNAKIEIDWANTAGVNGTMFSVTASFFAQTAVPAITPAFNQFMINQISNSLINAIKISDPTAFNCNYELWGYP